jgi:hypothetical protein
MKTEENYNIDNIRELVRSSEVHIMAQLQVAIAADQRAMGHSAIVAGMLTAAIGGTIALFLTEKQNIPLVISGLYCCITLMIALFCCTHAARPVPFNFPGSNPSQWTPGDLRNTQEKVLMEIVDNCKSYVSDNEKILGANSVYLRRAQIFMFISPISGLYGMVSAKLTTIFSEFSALAAAATTALGVVAVVTAWALSARR